MKSKEELITVYSETIENITIGDYINGNGDVVGFKKVSKLKKGTVMYQSLPKSKTTPFFDNPKVYVQNIDTLQKAKELGETCAVLNMASSRNPGGGVRNGSRAQEEELCRRSNLLLSLYSFVSQGKDLFGFSNTDISEYPIPCYGGIYSPCVNVFRSALSYSPLPEPFLCNVISVAGVIHPTLDPKTGWMVKKHVPVVKGKIRAILRIAILHGHSKLVLGALGCGAFKNPPAHVATLFKEVLQEEEFKNSFEEICFAILEDGNSKKSHNPDGNIKPFADVFGYGK